MYQYNAVVTRVVDGDTLDLNIDLGMNVHVKERVRLVGVNTPETYGVKKDSEEYAAGIKARDRVIELVENKEVSILTSKDKKGKYGRYLASVQWTSGDQIKNLGKILVEEGLAEYVNY